jgi:hypothetical protein
MEPVAGVLMGVKYGEPTSAPEETDQKYMDRSTSQTHRLDSPHLASPGNLASALPISYGFLSLADERPRLEYTDATSFKVITFRLNTGSTKTRSDSIPQIRAPSIAYSATVRPIPSGVNWITHRTRTGNAAAKSARATATARAAHTCLLAGAAASSRGRWSQAPVMAWGTFVVSQDKSSPRVMYIGLKTQAFKLRTAAATCALRACNHSVVAVSPQWSRAGKSC